VLPTSTELTAILRVVDLLLFELSLLDQQGPAITIVHQYRLRVHGAECQAGEEMARAVVTHRGRQAIIPLGLAPRLLLDYFGRSRYVPQSATQIVSQMRRIDFYQLHGLNLGAPRTRKISRSSIKEYVRRIRVALAKAFEQVSLPLDSRDVLISKDVGKEVLYQLRASVRWLHVSELDERVPRTRKAQ
jgi:hypothetical protein